MISVVIPVLNEERLLPRCLDSLKNQDYGGEYEIIVADNGSTDGTIGLAREYGVRVVECARRGVTSAREAGAKVASGDIIAQADADTVYPADWLSKIERHFASNPESTAITGNFVYSKRPWWHWLEFFVRNTINLLSVFIVHRPLFISGATFAFRRDEFFLIGGYEPNSASGDQYNIATRLSKIGRVAYDGTLLVTTSPRRVQKHVILLIFDIFANMARIAWYLSASAVFFFRKLSIDLPTALNPRLMSSLTLTALLIGSFFAHGYFVPGSQVFGKVYFKADASDKLVALTFDDGPNEPYTSQILDILDSYDVKATFFLIGKNVELYPETTKRMFNGGHIVGNHTYSHDANHALSDQGIKDIRPAQNAIYLVLGAFPHLYRPPHGKKSPWELEGIQRENLVEVNWSVATAELRGASAETIADRIISQTDPGEIILLHDGYGTEHYNKRADKSVTVQALPMIIQGLQEKGYKFVTVSELLGLPAYH